MEKRNCVKCGNEINPLRIKALPTTKTCVTCSDASKTKGIPVMRGTGEDTWVDIVLVDEKEYDKIEFNRNAQPDDYLENE